ncbi:hypothetical protein GCM10017600_66290 [Streptosporangium carneum]|uniref:Uncharacterized protein n=1 Tax=Streptosporangium carneum TaxID=47481 RepID=A0A9W6I7U1_9ACTN|nr:hypothetical protein GCM10017600_66290 [Streptosporangium carneum]
MKILLSRGAVSILGNDSPDGVYVLEPIEYVRSSVLPDNELLKDREAVKSLLRETCDSIQTRTRDKIFGSITRAIAEVEGLRV